MPKKLLITDVFFVNDEQQQKLESGGYEVTRLHKPQATPEELIEALKGVHVYMIGGIEQVTDEVIASTDTLEAIIFPGVDYEKFIPGIELARSKGIQILNTPGANAVTVAEFAVGTALLLQRQLLGLGRTGDAKFVSTRSLQDSVVGVIGAGNIAQAIMNGVEPFAPAEIIFSNRSPRDIGKRQVEMDELVQMSDVIFLTLPKNAGTVLDANLIANLKPGCLVVSISPMNTIDFDALLPRLQSGDVRCAVDWPSPSPAFDELPLDAWFSVNSHSAYNTKPGIWHTSEAAVEVALGLLAKG